MKRITCESYDAGGLYLREVRSSTYVPQLLYVIIVLLAFGARLVFEYFRIGASEVCVVWRHVRYPRCGFVLFAPLKLSVSVDRVFCVIWERYHYRS